MSTENHEVQKVGDPQTFKDLVAQDVKESLRKGRLLILIGIGLLLMLVGQWIVSHNEVSAEDVAAEVLKSLPPQNTASNQNTGKLPANPPWISKSAARFWGDFIIKLGELALISMALELLLHSDDYRQFFLDLVEKAVTGDRLVSRLGNSQYLWHRVSIVYFRLRFPKIYQRLSATLYDYFPTSYPYYLDQYNSSYRVETVSGTFIKMYQRISYTLTTTNASDPIPFKFGCKVFKRNNQDKLTSVSVTGMLVGPYDLAEKAKFESTEVNGKIELELKLSETVQGASEYKVLVEIQATWDIDLDPVESFTVQSLVNDLRVSVEYSDDLSIEWADLGVKDGFKNLFPKRLTISQIDKEYTGLVFKNQGYRFTIRKADSNAKTEAQRHDGRIMPAQASTDPSDGSLG